MPKIISEVQLFNVAAIKKQKIKDEEVVEEAAILVPPVSVLAIDNQQAVVSFVMQYSEQLKGIEKSRLSIVCSPF